MKKIGLIGSIVIISLLHYFSPVAYHQLHAVYQRLYYIPIIVSAYWFGWKTGLLFALLSALFYIPHILLHWSHLPPEAFTQYVEIVMFFVVAGLVGVFSDIQRAQAMALEKAGEQIRRMDRLSLLGQLAAGLAHEIRNPLGSLIGSAEILQDDLKEHPDLEFVQIMKKELNRMRDKLNEFLRFAKPAPPQKILNNINDVVTASVALLQKEATKSNTTITMELEKTLPLVPMDADQLKQVLLNLLLNAIQAMPDGGEIVVTTVGDSKTIGFTVDDEGPGISPDEREKIFEPFFTTKDQGTGLGLAIVKQLVDAMNGTVNVIPRSHGTRFKVRIPYE